MNWDNIDWNNFSCVAMSRAIKDEMDVKFAEMTGDEIVNYLHEIHVNFDVSKPPRNTLEKRFAIDGR
jgi:hypothetical protein